MRSVLSALSRTQPHRNKFRVWGESTVVVRKLTCMTVQWLAANHKPEDLPQRTRPQHDTTGLQATSIMHSRKVSALCDQLAVCSFQRECLAVQKVCRDQHCQHVQKHKVNVNVRMHRSRLYSYLGPGVRESCLLHVVVMYLAAKPSGLCSR